MNRQATDELILAGGDKVKVRQRLTAAEEAELTRGLMRLRVDGATGTVDVQEGDWHLQRLAVVKAYILGWNFTDEDGTPVPFNLEKVDDLDGDTIEEIARLIDVAQKERRELREKKVGKS